MQGDLNDEVSLRLALAGVWGAYSVQNTWEAGVEGEELGKRFATLAKGAGVQHLVYSSVERLTGRPASRISRTSGGSKRRFAGCGALRT